MENEEMVIDQNINEVEETVVMDEMYPIEATDMQIATEESDDSGSGLAMLLTGAAVAVGGYAVYKAGPKIANGCRKLAAWGKKKKEEKVIRYAVKHGLYDEIALRSATEQAEAEGITADESILDETMEETEE